ncbi:unnamed protein product [Alternaria alternata]
MASRRRLRAGSMDDRIAPDVHEFASHLVRDHPLGEAEQKKEAHQCAILSLHTNDHTWYPPYTPDKGELDQK